MTGTTQDQSHSDTFGGAYLVSAYTRAQAIADGYLIDVTETAREAGFRLPVAMTHAAWVGCVEWDQSDSQRQVYQDQEGRLWDVLSMAMNYARVNQYVSEFVFTFYRVPRGGRGQKARQTFLKAVVAPGDDGKAVLTIQEPNED